MLYNNNGTWTAYKYKLVYTVTDYGDFADGYPPDTEVTSVLLSSEQEGRLEEIQGIDMPEQDAIAYVRDGIGTVPDTRDQTDKLIDKLLELDPDGATTRDLILDSAREWHADDTYDCYMYVKFEGVVYKTIHPIRAHDTENPPSAPALYARIGAIEGGEIVIEEWRQPTGEHDAYKTGDKVLHNGQTWVCTLGDASGLNSWEPGVYGWEIVAT